MKSGYQCKNQANQVLTYQLTFRSPKLAGHQWTVHEIVAEETGPKLCIMAGIHVNEVSSIEATFQLIEKFRTDLRRGTVSIIPVVNTPALQSRSEYICPIDGKNINFSFPGSSEGTFSEALADAILNEWSADADCLIDLHGGDLCETVAQFTVAPMIGDPKFDQLNLQLAAAFEPEIIVQLRPDQLAKPGRSCSGRAMQGKHAAFAEAGRNGVIEEHNVSFLRNGVLRIAGLLGMMDLQPPSLGRKPIVAREYVWVRAEVDGWCRYHVEPGEKVVQGQLLASISDYTGKLIHEVKASTDGYILWRCTHAIISSTTDLMGIATEVI